MYPYALNKEATMSLPFLYTQVYIWDILRHFGRLVIFLFLPRWSHWQEDLWLGDSVLWKHLLHPNLFFVLGHLEKRKKLFRRQRESLESESAADKLSRKWKNENTMIKKIEGWLRARWPKKILTLSTSSLLICSVAALRTIINSSQSSSALPNIMRNVNINRQYLFIAFSQLLRRRVVRCTVHCPNHIQPLRIWSEKMWPQIFDFSPTIYYFYQNLPIILIHSYFQLVFYCN